MRAKSLEDVNLIGATLGCNVKLLRCFYPFTLFALGLLDDHLLQCAIIGCLAYEKARDRELQYLVLQKEVEKLRTKV